MKSVCLLALLVSVIPDPIAQGALAAANIAEVEVMTGQVIPVPAAWDHGFPVPAGARNNAALGGATSIAPGKNYTVKVYDIDAGIDTMAVFYERHLRTSKRKSEGQELWFFTRGGHVRLARFAEGTRITLVIGPH